MGIAQLAQALGPTAPSEMRILPAGDFRAVDGRPAEVTAWQMNASIAKAVIASSFVAKRDLLIDYEHQSLRAMSNGQAVPAAGWFSGMEWRDNDGLYAISIQWNEQAKRMIEAREYRFISPVFSYNEKTGAVTSVFSVAVTNTPALPGLFDFANKVVAASSPPSAAATSLGGDARNQRGMELLARMMNSTNNY